MDSLAGLKGVEVGSVFLRNNAIIRCRSPAAGNQNSRSKRKEKREKKETLRKNRGEKKKKTTRYPGLPTMGVTYLTEITLNCIGTFELRTSKLERHCFITKSRMGPQF
eukprot:bmy_13616T0